MNALLDTVVADGTGILIGVTALLAVFVLAAVLARRPDTRCRLATLGLAGALFWAVASLVPLPRPLADWRVQDVATGAESTAGLETSTTAMAPIRPSRAIRDAAPLESYADLAVRLAPITSFDEETSTFDLGRLLAITWLIGCAAFVLRFAIAQLRLRRLLRLTHAAPTRVLRLLPNTRGRSISVSVVDRDVVPFVAGVRRPTIVLPRSLLAERRRTDLTHVLAHEVAHVLERHVVDRTLFALARPLLWFHPLFFVLRRQSERSAELVADAIAGGADPLSYAEALMRLVPARGVHVAPSVTAPVYRSKSEFSRRIEMLVKSSSRVQTMNRPASVWRRRLQSADAVCFVALAIGASGTEIAKAQDTKRERKRAEAVPPAESTDRKASAPIDSASPPTVDPGLESAVDPSLGPRVQRAQDSAKRHLAALTEVWHAVAQDPAKADTGVLGRLLRDDTIADQLRALLKQVSEKAVQDAQARATLNALAVDDSRIVRVQKGDSLYGIARRYLGDANRVHEIRALNPKIDERKLRTGLKLRIPAPRAASVSTAEPVRDSWEALDLVRQVIELEGKERLLMLEIDAQPHPHSRREIETRLMVTMRTRKAVQAALMGERRATEIELQSVARRMRMTPDNARLQAHLARLEARLSLLRKHDGGTSRSRKKPGNKSPNKAPSKKRRSG